MGELRTRIFLSLRLPLERAIAASAGWGGDAYVVLERAAGERPAILWSTVWDDETAAKRFEAALREATACAGDDEACPYGKVAMRREEARVAWVRGLDGGDDELAALLALPGAPIAPIAALGKVKLASDEDDDGALLDDPPVTLASFGVRFVVPQNFRVKKPETLSFLMDDTAHHARAYVMRTDGPFDDANEAQTRSVLSAIFGGSYALRYEGARDVELPIGRGRELAWAIDDAAGGTIRATMIPVCHGAHVLSFVRIARSEETRVDLARWLASVEPSAPGLPPVCAMPKGAD